MLTGRDNLTKAEAAQFNPVTLAFVGDAVYSTYVRERLALSGNGKAADFQRAAIKIVSAKGQSAFLDRILPLLTEQESEIFRRGKNAKKATKSKSASSLEYNRSTGFEAVLGYLYLTGEEERIGQLLSNLTEEDFKIPEKTQGLRSFR
ncbi:MAG: ribonuclease III [Clostridia bacterium]|nr:ribonuclease III [Clostridia bacterium]